MIIYTENNKLITTTIDDVKDTLELSTLYLEAERFSCKDNRFFKIISEEAVTRSLKYPLQESMKEEAIKRFRRLTNVYNSLQYYDRSENIGYVVFPHMKNPTIYTYSMLYPAITEFFHYWKEFNYTASSMRGFSPTFDLSSLFSSMENFKDLELIFTKEEGEFLRKTLYKEFPEFAIFFYEIYPYLNLRTVDSLDIPKLINARMLVDELGFDTSDLDEALEDLDIAENNGKVLRLIKQKNKYY